VSFWILILPTKLQLKIYPFDCLYASGLRITECLRLRGRISIFLRVRDAKGNKDRETLLSASLVKPLQSAIDVALNLQKKDNELGVGPSLPYQLKGKLPYFSSLFYYLFIAVRSRYSQFARIVGSQRYENYRDYTHVLNKGGLGVRSPLDI
jgi:integrase